MTTEQIAKLKTIVAKNIELARIEAGISTEELNATLDATGAVFTTKQGEYGVDVGALCDIARKLNVEPIGLFPKEL